MRMSSLAEITFLLLASICHAQQNSVSPSSVPILVELFTSEGCSSCPPADRFLEYLDTQPLAGAKIVVLSEHVDYWNRQGWKDPYSSRDASERQAMYGKRFRLAEVYTPQFVIDGSREIPADGDQIHAALAEALGQKKATVRMVLSEADANRIKVKVETDLRDIQKSRTVDIYLVVALNHVETAVSAGENARRTLSHTAVARRLTRIGSIRGGVLFSQDVDFKAEEFHKGALRIIAFAQDRDNGKVYGATLLPITTPAPKAEKK